MRKSLKRIVSGLTALATVSSMLLTVAPAYAAPLTNVSDTLTREAVSVEATHTFAGTFPSFSNGNIVTLAYGDAGFALYNSSPTCAMGTGTCTATVSGTDVRITCTAGGGCSGAITLGTFAGVNPGTAGSKAVVVTGNGDPVSDTFAIPIMDSDQVTVTATVSPSITFDIDTSTSNSNTNAPYTVALGSLTTASVSGSDESAINSIWLDLDTNASGGAVITVSSTNSSLKSTSVPGDTIPSASAQMSPGTANYGLCVKSVTATTGSATATSPFNNAICDQTPVGNIVGGLTGTAQNLLNTNSAEIAGMRAEIMVDAAISALTAAHNDYTDTLKFIATGTF